MAFDERLIGGVGVLAAIVESGSFARAGEVLNMSQSGVSRAVARLEARLGTRLFDRTTRSVTLTEEGRRFYEQVVPLMAGLEEAASSAAMGAKAVRGRLRINVDPFFSRLILGPRLGAFLALHPDLQLDLVTRDQLGDMIAEGFDLAVRFGYPQSSSLVARRLLETRILTVAAPSYLARHGWPSTPDELVGHTCIQFREADTGRPYAWEFHRGGERKVVATRGQLMVNEAGTLLGASLAGYGISQIMAWGSEELLATGQLMELFPDWPDERFPLYALHPSRHYQPAKTRAFLDFLVGLAEEGTA
ncbi:LysR family transcriptional regulator [Chitinimonas sp.]|uniref:LysR family transcriptional regulator n=1 Tax=Chitinimonas sp. TaxID=1934313 RepID=UPI002F91D810